MVRPTMSFTELPLSFWGYALEMAAKLLNMAPSKTMAQTPYKIWHGKPVSYKYLRMWGRPAYVKRLMGDKLDSRSSLCRFVGYPKKTTGYYFYDPSEHKVFVSLNAVFLEKEFPADTRREELLLEESSEAAPQTDIVTSSAPIVPTNNISVLRRSTRVSQQPERCGPWQIPPRVLSPLGVNRSTNVSLGLKLPSRPGLWRKMDVKMAFLNGFVEEEIYMDQPEGFPFIGEEQKVYHLQRSIYGLKQASRSWNIHFDEVIRGYDFIKNDFDPCVYKKVSGSSVVFLVLYVDDILLIENDVKMLYDTKAWLSTQFFMKDLGKASYILGIKLSEIDLKGC
ncbi:UNVERIFIED_CONTAM: Retrovirus-related Pol polyprotein from transposon RE1 [Sesamum radiatum]|uniref:Retrovirus-related Pol polyprotein from transposon RE1 n=1 Tax=Sesamum radiatum TaxID=300843 RepID=A0AAW2JGU2_SESRA